jgi:hypothetical protein
LVNNIDGRERKRKIDMVITSMKLLVGVVVVVRGGGRRREGGEVNNICGHVMCVEGRGTYDW